MARAQVIPLPDHSRSQNWFVAQLKPNGLAMAQRNLDRQGLQHFAPLRHEAVRTPRGMGRRARPLFPGYIFVTLEPFSPQWRAVSATRGISRLVIADPRSPRPLPDAFLDELRARCDASGTLCAARDAFAPGDQVRILSGPFAEIVAMVDHLDEEDRLRLIMDLLGQKVTVTIPAHIAEKAG
ncbi:MAG: transcription termination/antitermination NusG family protein [Celeribacter sp.]